MRTLHFCPSLAGQLRASLIDHPCLSEKAKEIEKDYDDSWNSENP